MLKGKEEIKMSGPPNSAFLLSVKGIACCLNSIRFESLSYFFGLGEVAVAVAYQGRREIHRRFNPNPSISTHLRSTRVFTGSCTSLLSYGGFLLYSLLLLFRFDLGTSRLFWVSSLSLFCSFNWEFFMSWFWVHVTRGWLTFWGNCYVNWGISSYQTRTRVHAGLNACLNIVFGILMWAVFGFCLILEFRLGRGWGR